MSKIYIGIDNGTTGTIGVVSENQSTMFYTPTKKEQDYTSKKKNVTRLDVLSFISLFERYDKDSLVFVMERPMINPKRFTASICAVRCFESELSQIELMGCRHLFIDSKKWQSDMLPSGCKGEEQKKESLDIGNRLFPNLSDFKHTDRDGLLIAEWARRKNL